MESVPRGRKNVIYRITPLTGAEEGQAADKYANLFVRVPSNPHMTITRTDNGAINIGWTAPKVNPGWVSGYQVDRMVDWNGHRSWSLASGSDSLTDDLADVAAGARQLRYSVTALTPDYWGNPSSSYKYLDTVYVRVPGPLSQLTARQHDDGDVKLDWREPTIQSDLINGYRVERQNSRLRARRVDRSGSHGNRH